MSKATIKTPKWEKGSDGWSKAEFEGADLTMSPDGAVLYRVGYKKVISAPSFMTAVRLATGPDAPLTTLGQFMDEQAKASKVSTMGRAGRGKQGVVAETIAELVRAGLLKAPEPQPVA